MKNNRRTFMQNLVALTAGSLFPFGCKTTKSASTPMQNRSSIKRPKLLILDVNETLLDLSGMKARMNQAFDQEDAFSQWFAYMLQYSLVDNVTAQYHDFGAIGKAAFQMTEQKLKKRVPDEVRDEVLRMIRTLPPHPDVPQGLAMLREAGYRMVTLTNSTEEVVRQQMESAGLSDYFETLLSIDAIKKYKPALETYKMATEKGGVRPQEAMLIAAHGWDVTGALHAGLQAAFISREGQVQYPLAPKPHFTGDNLVSIAEQLVSL
ncbi:haloacid dehalogenase type II [Telluribacter sp.]|jgi:2-haloacid dehalogenase|uniref:haloacid dehalogenase type II n=1 Tax=Telluribacter sp. TaxID=1978767 RepID=UPI002E11976D|nr:haloacid dehalogenase type II [Telluribacter sp.]